MVATSPAHTTWIFGRSCPLEPLTADSATALRDAAYEHQTGQARVSLSTVLAILDRVGQEWANPRSPFRQKALAVLPGLIGFSRAMVEEGLKAVAGICAADGLRKRLHGEFGHAGILEGWVTPPGLDHSVRAVPRGPVLHLAAGNVFVGVVDSLVSGIITRNANIVKMSRVDPVFPVLFLDSIKAHDPEGAIWPHQAIVEWKGGQTEVEAPLFHADLTVVFWGGKEALQSVRSRIGPAVRLVENGPRYSFAVADAQSLCRDDRAESIRGLALDISRWDQQACSSPHVVYCLGGGKKAVEALMREVAAAMEALAQSLPRGDLTFDEKVEIRRVRELGKMAQAVGEGLFLGPRQFHYSLIFEAEPAFKISCLNRTVFFKSVPTVARLLEEIRPLGEYLQSVGLFVAPARFSALEKGLLALGATRLTAWGGMSSGRAGAPHEGSYLLRSLVNFVSREAIPSLFPRPDGQLERLYAALKTSPFYRQRLQKKPWKDLQSGLAGFPMLDRETLYKFSPPESTDILSGPLTDAYVYASGGTTGRAKYILYSNREYRYVTDVLADIYRIAGIERTDSVGNLFLAGNLWTSFNVAGRALENIGCLHLPIGGMTEFANLVQYLRDFQVNALVGLPSVMLKLAEEAKKHNVRLRIDKILYGGEHLREAMREYLTGILGCQWIRSAGYACVDTGPIGFQCPHLPGAIHHELDCYQWMEIVPAQTDQPTEVMGEIGEIVATNLDRTLMPVIRFRTGDLGRWTDVPSCPCGFSGRSFELLGRCDDLMVLGGINLMPTDLAAGLSGLAVSPNFQAVARNRGKKDLLVLRLEAEKPLRSDVVKRALEAGCYKLHEALDDGWLELAIEWFAIGGIPRNPRTGKLRVMIDERS